MSDHLDLGAGILKRIYIDPQRLRAGDHAWTIATEAGRVVAAALQIGPWAGVYSREPLFTGGPNCWLETTEDALDLDAMDAEVIVWPVPLRGPGSQEIEVGAGVTKRVHVDRHRLRVSDPAWTVRTDQGLLITEGLDLADGAAGVQSRTPLFHGGPKAWVEATCAVEVVPENRIHQSIFPQRLSPLEVPPNRGHR